MFKERQGIAQMKDFPFELRMCGKFPLGCSINQGHLGVCVSETFRMAAAPVISKICPLFYVHCDRCENKG